MKGWTKKICVIILMIAICVAVFAACKGNVPSPDDKDIKPTTKQVSVAMTEVYNAIKASNHSEGVDVFTLTFNGTYSGEKELTYAFAANFDIRSTNLENDTFSELSLIIAEETGSIIEIFYKEGYLYVDYPPFINKGKFAGLNLAPLVKSFYDSNKPNGKIDALAALIPTLGNLIFSDCVYSRENNVATYNFSISYEALFDSLTAIMQLADIGIGRNEVLAVFGLSVSDVLAFEANGVGNVKITTVSSGGVAMFDKAEYTSSHTIEGINERKGFVIKDFVLKNGASLVAMPTNLATAYTSHSLGNLDLVGSIIINAYASNTTVPFGLSNYINARLSSANYTYFYTLKSNISPTDGATMSLELSSSEGKTLKFYYSDSILYMDLTDIGLGKLLTSADWIEEALEALGMLGSGQALTTNQTIAILAELLSRSVNTNNLTSYSIGGSAIEMLLDSVGYTSFIKYDDITLTFDTTNNRLQSMSLAIDALGAKMTLTATSPKIGAAVTISQPAWITDCVDITITDRFTPVISGTFNAATLASDDVTLLEKFVESLTGEAVAFTATSRTNIKYIAKANINGEGELYALKVDFNSVANGDYICSFYYTKETDNKFYVIYPTIGGVNPVTTHTIKTSERYSMFMQAINGNAIGDYGDALYSLTNSDTSVTIGANRAAINSMLASITDVFSGNIFAFIPNDFAIVDIESKFSSGEVETRVNFFDNKYITFTIEDFALEYYDIGIASIAVNNRSVSIYQDNNMEAATKVTFGDGSEKTLSLKTSGGDSLWSYNNKPTVGTGVVNVNASVTLLGRVFVKNIEVNTAHYASASIVGSASSYYNNINKVFTFPRYNCNDNPIDIISAFNRAAITTAVTAISNKEVRWYYSGADIRTGGLDTFNHASFGIVPVVSSFFGDNIELFAAGTYTVNIEGAKAIGIVDSANYLTITAYDGNNPFAESTYYGAEVELEGGATLIVNALRWDISSIRTGTINNISYLNSELYKAEGTYLIDAIVADSVGNEKAFAITINVIPRQISQAVFATYAEGVSYESYTVGTDRIIGKFTFNPMIITEIKRASIFANTAICNDAAFSLSSLKWEITPVASINIFAGLSGEMSLIIGNEVGGYQTFRMLYEVPAVAVTQVGLADINGDIIVYDATEQIATVTSEAVSFSLLGLDPYDYIYPAKVVFYYSEGEHTFEVNWAFGWDITRLWIEGAAHIYSATFAKTNLLVHLDISFEAKIIEDFKFVEGEPTNDDTVTFDKLVEGSPVEVNLTYKLLDGQKRFIFASYGAFDSSKAYDYTDVDNYPTSVYVKFLGEEGWRIMDIEWDLSVYSNRSAILQNGFSGALIAKIALNQSIETIYVSIASSYPDDVFVEYELEEGVPVATDKKVRFSILKMDNGSIVITDPRDIDNFPTQLYFSYSPVKNLDSGWFTLEEWILTDVSGANIIEAYYLQQLGLGVALQNIANGSIVVTARFGNAHAGYIDIPVEVAISASLMSEEVLEGIPLANTSVSGGGSSQHAMEYAVDNGMPSLTVNPYIANPKTSSSYPTKLKFKLNNDNTITMDISSWDLSSIPSSNLHFGTTGNYYLIYALINVGMDIGAIRLPVKLNVIPRVVEKVWVDGSSAKNIHIDPYSLQPFGQNVEDGYAYKSVVAKFFNDDNTYPMVMKYDISNITLSYTGGAVAYGITVHIGNEAGGYQPVNNYNIYIRQSLIVEISSDAEVDDTPIGVIYTATEVGGVLQETFKDLSSDELSAILSNNALTIKFGTPTEITKTRIVSEYDGILEGLIYQWKRDAEGVLYLELWNNNPLYAEVLGDNQIISSGLTNFVQITANLFQNLPEEGLTLTYSAGRAAEGYIESLQVTSLIFSEEEMQAKIVRVSDTYELLPTDIMNAGEYMFVITVVGHREYGGSIAIPIMVNPIVIGHGTDFTIRQFGLPIGLNYSKNYNGIAVVLDVVTSIPNLSLSINYGEFSGNPINAGVYPYSVVSNNPNYSCSVVGSVTILAQVIDETNSTITVSATDAFTPPVIVVTVSSIVLTTSDYSVYYGYSNNPESINIQSYPTFIDGLDFGSDESKEAYVKLVINIANYQVTTVVRAFTVYKGEA